MLIQFSFYYIQVIQEKGRYLEISLGTNTFVGGIDPILNGSITYSADHVTFYKTVYDNTIYSYFKRGRNADEEYENHLKFLLILKN